MLLVASAAVFGQGCSGPQKLSANSSMPSAEGTLECDSAANDNTGIDLKVKHLPHPDRLTPPAAVYVVWMKNGSVAPQNIGALTVDKDLSGRLKTVTAHRRSDLFVTGEASGEVTAPSGPPLLWANCSR